MSIHYFYIVMLLVFQFLEWYSGRWGTYLITSFISMMHVLVTLWLSCLQKKYLPVFERLLFSPFCQAILQVRNKNVCVTHSCKIHWVNESLC